MSKQRVASIHRLMDDLAESKAEIERLRADYVAAGERRMPPAATQWRDELNAEVERLQAMIDRSGLDIVACERCGEAMLALPDGLAMCVQCYIRCYAAEAGGNDE